MSLFWFLGGLMVLLALAFLLRPLLRNPQGSKPVSQTELSNVSVYKERQAELDAELAEEKLSQDEYQELCVELQRSLVADAEAENEAEIEIKDAPRSWVLPAMLMLVLPLASYALYAKLGSSDLLGLPSAPMAEQNPHSTGMGDVIAELEAELEANPQNSQGWFTLGRTFVAMERFAEGAAAFDKVTALVGEHAEILAQKAQALYFHNDNQMTPEVRAIVDKAVELDPNDPGLNGLLGIYYYEYGQYELAIASWQRMLENARADMNTQGVIGAIEQAKARLAEMPSKATANSFAATASEIESEPAAGVFGGQVLKVLVELDASLVAQAQPSDVVFVALKQAGGRPMPLAAQRMTVSELPKLVSLSDRDVLMQGGAIAPDAQLQLVATVSKSGTAGTRSGDLLGRSQPQAFSELSQQVSKINIDQLAQ